MDMGAHLKKSSDLFRHSVLVSTILFERIRDGAEPSAGEFRLNGRTNEHIR